MIIHSVKNSLGNSCTAATENGLIRMLKERCCLDCNKEAEQNFRQDNSQSMLEHLLLTDCGMKWSYTKYQGLLDEY